MNRLFHGYVPYKGEIAGRRTGVLISNASGEATAYSLFYLQERGRMFVDPGEPLYEGMVVGLHSRDNDLVVNPVKTKQLTNIRAAGKDEAMLLTPPIRHTLESAVEFIADDELVEITPSASAQAPAARARAQTRLPRRRLRKSPPAGGGQVTGWWEQALT
jgi:GTP-binding protein